MKKIIALLLITTIIFAGCSSNKETTSENTKETTTEASNATNEAVNTETEATNAKTETATTTDTATNQEAESTKDTKSDAENIEITIPALYMEGSTQEELDQEFSPYATATINDDGSVTFVMSKTMHAALLEIVGKELANELNAVPGSTDFPNVTAIEMNDDFTEINLTTTATEATDDETMSALYVYMFGKMYNIFNQTETNVVTVNLKNADSGENIYTSDSVEMDALIKTVQETE